MMLSDISEIFAYNDPFHYPSSLLRKVLEYMSLDNSHTTYRIQPVSSSGPLYPPLPHAQNIVFFIVRVRIEGKTMPEMLGLHFVCC
jgi:hypothetical protein